MEVDTEQAGDTVETIDCQSDDDSEKRPIMLLLKRLIRNKQNTVMTNTQILDILKQEFNIDIKSCHEVEVDIYIKIIKRFLKDWPQWEELERISTKLSTAKDFDAVTKVLNHKYKNLKEYLGVMLEAAKPLAKEEVSKLEQELNKTDNLASSTDVVMEVQCTRHQLNHLFVRKPRLDLNNVFNIEKIEPTHISLNVHTFESILNFWWTKIYINLPNFIFFREMGYKLKHKLVNKARNDHSLPMESLDTRMYNRSKKCRAYPKNIVNNFFDKIIELCKDEHVIQVLQVMFQIIKTEMEGIPKMIKAPSSYRKYANRYNYCRYLYVDNTKEDSKYDLQLEESNAPIYQVFIGRLGKLEDIALGPALDWLQIECMLCKYKFQGCTELMTLVQAHFNDYHQHEPEWQCTHCKRLFSVDFLSRNKWYHEC